MDFAFQGIFLIKHPGSALGLCNGLVDIKNIAVIANR